MIINFHPKEIPSNKGGEVIARLNKDNKHQVVHATDKSGKAWQDVISSPEKLILIAPVYWWGASYEFDKWLQEVFSYGYAFQYNDQGGVDGLLNGREFELHMTHGTPKDYSATMRDVIKTRMETGVFGFCKAKVTVHFYDMTE